VKDVSGQAVAAFAPPEDVVDGPPVHRVVAVGVGTSYTPQRRSDHQRSVPRLPGGPMAW
jgi:hypothetical protein